MNPAIQNGLSLCVFLLLSSCIRDELQPCPPLQAQLTVKDKNYFNVNSVPLETPKSESLAFSQYIPTLYYTLRDAATGDIVEEQGVFNVTGNETTLPITFCNCLPYGKYILTAWGGLTDNSTLTDNSLTNIIHKNAQEGSDVYLTHDTLIYDLQHTNYTLDMERITGKLLIQVENLPADVLNANKSISKVYERANHQFGYFNPLTVGKYDTWQPTTNIVLSTILAPSTGDLASLLHIDFYKSMSDPSPDLTPKDVYITMKRNELTTLKYVYDDERRDFFIYMILNDAWELIYNLDID